MNERGYKHTGTSTSTVIFVPAETEAPFAGAPNSTDWPSAEEAMAATKTKGAKNFIFDKLELERKDRW